MTEEMTPELWRQWAIETAISQNLAGKTLTKILKQADILLNYIKDITPVPSIFIEVK